MNKRKAKKLIKKLDFKDVVKYGSLKPKFTFHGLIFCEKEVELPNLDL